MRWNLQAGLSQMMRTSITRKSSLLKLGLRIFKSSCLKREVPILGSLQVQTRRTLLVPISKLGQQVPYKSQKMLHKKTLVKLWKISLLIKKERVHFSKLTLNNPILKMKIRRIDFQFLRPQDLELRCTQRSNHLC